jgi:response regulator NasT
VLVDIRLQDDKDGIDLAAEMLAKRRSAMIVVSAFSDPKLVERAASAGVFGYLIKPVSPETLAAQVEVAFHRYLDADRLQTENQSLAQALENRKVIEKAKGIFMKRFNLDEHDAHYRLQKESQKRRITMPEMAKIVIDSAAIMGEAEETRMTKSE